jgi:rod shape determining protein RodA
MTLAAPPGSAQLRKDPSAPWRYLDLVLLFCAGTIATLGVLTVYSATKGSGPIADTSAAQRQALFVVVGVIVMGITALIDYELLRHWARLIYVGMIVLLAGVLVVGTEVKGIRAWFLLGPIQLQPSELAKVGLVIVLAWYLARQPAELPLASVATALGLSGVLMGLILLQPDLGTMLVFVVTTMGMLLVGGIRPKHMVVLLLIGAIGVTAILSSGTLEDYQTDRLKVFVDPEGVDEQVRYNLAQAQIAISSGGMLGQGWGEGSQTQLDFVPEQQTDFIFTAVGEELGFVGAGLLLLLYGVMCMRILRTAHLARDRFGMLLATGALCVLAFHVFQNIGMSMGIMPITGIPLPLMSAGGSSTLAWFVLLGLVLNVRMRRYR